MFAGAGGVACGAVIAGIKPSFAIEFDPTNPTLSEKLADLHDRNFRDYGCIVIRRTVQDVARLGFPGFPKNEFLHASPVCTNFSQAKQGEEQETDLEMANAIAKAIRILSPKVFTLEQVPAYKKSASWEIVRSQLIKFGYKFAIATINMSDYGIPQNRKRLIVAAAKEFTPVIPEPTGFVSWWDVIADLVPIFPDSKLVERQLSAIANQPLPLLIPRVGNYRVQPVDKPCQTLTKSHFYDGKGGHRSKFMDLVLPDGSAKQITLRGAARLQGFPDWYDLDFGAGIGYSVPPLFMSILFKSLLEQINDTDSTNNLRRKSTHLDCDRNKPSGTKISSPLKWAGGKSSIIDKVSEIWESFGCDRWVDLFCGGCSLPLAIAPDKVLINDTNPHLVDFWRWLQSGAIATIEYKNDEDYYYQMRSQFNQSPSPELFYYLNRTGFNGLCRYNSKGQFNVPFGKYKKINYRTNFTEYKDAIASWEITNQSFQYVPLLPGDFVFADPPYDDGFVNYAPGGFTWENQVELAEKLARHDGFAIATNKATDRILDLYSSFGFKIKIIKMPRRISCNGDRPQVEEMFAVKS